MVDHYPYWKGALILTHYVLDIHLVYIYVFIVLISWSN